MKQRIIGAFSALALLLAPLAAWAVPAPITSGYVAPAVPSQMSPLTWAIVGDSIAEIAEPHYNSDVAITSTTAGDSAVTISNVGFTAQWQTGDLIQLCSVAGCLTGTVEQHTVANSWAGPGTAAIPITDTVAHSGLLFARAYSSRLPYFGTNANYSWWFIANGSMGWPMQLAQGPGFGPASAAGVPTSAALRDAVYTIPGGTSSQMLGLAPYTDQMGQTTTQNWVSWAIASGAQNIFLEIGVNDYATFNAIPAATTIANVQSAVNQIRAAGRNVYIGTNLPRADPVVSNVCAGTNMNAAGYNSQAQVNNFIRSLAYSHLATVIDFNRALANPQSPINWLAAGTNGNGSVGGTDGIPAGTSFSPDCVHPYLWAGAWTMASEFRKAVIATGMAGPITESNGYVANLANTYGLGSTATTSLNNDLMYSATFGANHRGNMVTNGGMSNTAASCTPGGGSAGQCADGWSTSVGTTPTGGSYAWSVVAKSNALGNPYDRGYWQQMQINQGSGSSGGSMSMFQRDVVSLGGQSLGPTKWQVGDWIYAQANVRVIDGCAGANAHYASYPSIGIQFFGAAAFTGDAYGIQPNTPETPSTVDSCPAFMTVRTPPVQIPPNTTRVYMFIYWQGAGTAQFSDAEMKEYYP